MNDAVVTKLPVSIVLPLISGIAISNVVPLPLVNVNVCPLKDAVTNPKLALLNNDCVAEFKLLIDVTILAVDWDAVYVLNDAVSNLVLICVIKLAVAAANSASVTKFASNDDEKFCNATIDAVALLLKLICDWVNWFKFVIDVLILPVDRDAVNTFNSFIETCWIAWT